MALNNRDEKLLSDIFSTCLNLRGGINRSRFRVDNEEFIPNLDRLERDGYILRSDNEYLITLLSLIHLAEQNTDAQNLLKECGAIFAYLKTSYKDNLERRIPVSEIAQKTALSEDDAAMALKFMVQAPTGLGYSTNATNRIEAVSPSEGILRYKSFHEVVRQQGEWEKLRDNRSSNPKSPAHVNHKSPTEQAIAVSADSKANWDAIEMQFSVSKISFGMRISFVTDPFRRLIIFRDVGHAYALAAAGFSKPAVILAGSVIEELLRMYLEYKGITPQKPLKKDFNGYIQTCVQNKLLKDSVSRLSDSVRGFRNLVHLSAEETKKHTISKATAIGAVSSIFTIANDF
jgi:hypothetical protein